MKTRITLSFRGKHQLPWFMIIKEYYDVNDDLFFAKVLFEFWPTGKKFFVGQ